MEHRLLPKHTSHHHEALLGRDEPVPNQQARAEALLQAKLDVATTQMNAMAAQSRVAAQKEMDNLHQRVDRELAAVIGQTKGLRVVDPSAPRVGENTKRDQKPVLHASTPATSMQRLRATGLASSTRQPTHSSVRASGLVVHPTASDRVAVTASTQPSTSARLVSSTGASAANNATWSAHRQGTTPAATHTTSTMTASARDGTRTLSVDASASPSNYTFGFPSPFPVSGFQSVVRWADVSFQEAQVAALGPRTNVSDLRTHEPPNRVVVSVACYLLNEVLSRDPNLQALWAQLRIPIFDAVFSPQLLAAHLARHQTRLAQREERAGIGAAETIHIAEEDGVLPPLPLRTATYDDVSSFASYRLWIEEHVGACKDNHRLHERVEKLKDVVANSRLVLLLAQRRVETTRKRSIFLAWHAYTGHAKNQREVVSTYVTESRHRRISESCFLRWRRLTVQNTLADVRAQYYALRKKWESMSETHHREISTLNEKLAQETSERQTMVVRDAALRAQINDSYAMESMALRTALSHKQRQCKQLLAHAKRWERLAKTFRPIQVAPAVPRQLLTFGIRLRRFEDEFSAATAQNTRVFRLVNARASMSKFLLRWTNGVMGLSPYKNMWVNVKRLATRRDLADVQVDLSSLSYQEAITASAASASNPEVFSSYSLIYLVRELRRLIDCERRERSASAALKSVLGATNDPTAMSGADGDAPAGSTFSLSKAKQWVTELQQQQVRKPSDVSVSDSSDEVEGQEGTAAADDEPAPPDLVDDDSADPTSEGALQRQLFAELCEVLYLLTEEGSRPSLLMHCPYLGSFFSASLFAAVPLHPTALFWVLAALFIGYVETLCSFQNPFFRGQWPPYLRCGNETSLARRPNPSLTTIEDAEDMGLCRGVLPPSSGAGRASNATTTPATHSPAAQGTYVMSRNSTVGKQPNAAPDFSTDNRSKRGSHVAGTRGGRSRLRRQNSTRHLGRVLPTKSVRVTKMTDLELVNRGIDTEADIMAYIGRGDALESSLYDLDGEETDVEALMAGLEESASRAGSPRDGGRSPRPQKAQPYDEPDSARARRRQRRLDQEQLRRTISAGSDDTSSPPMIAFTGETILNSDDEREEGMRGSDGRDGGGRRPASRTAKDDGVAPSRSPSFYLELAAIEEGPRTGHKGAPIAKAPNDATRTTDKGDLTEASDEDADEALNELGLRDDMTYLRAVLRAQETVEAEKATALLMSPKKSLFSAEELYTLFRLPPPSHAFDARAVLVQRDHRAVTSANSSCAGASRSGYPNKGTSTTEGGEKRAGEAEAGAAAAVSVSHPTTSMSAFLTYTLLDADRRQLWQGMARVVTSLITRFRVLDTATSTNTATTAVSAAKTRAWRKRKSDARSGLSGRSSSNRSLSSRSSSFVGVPDDDPALTSARLAKPVRRRGRRSSLDETGDASWLSETQTATTTKIKNTRPTKSKQNTSGEDSTETKAKERAAAVPAGSVLPPILRNASPGRLGQGSPAPSVPPAPDTVSSTTTAQLAEALQQFNDSHPNGAAEVLVPRAASAPDKTLPERTPPAATISPPMRPTSSSGASHQIVVRTQHANTAHYSSPPPIAPGVPGDLHLANACPLPSSATGPTIHTGPSAVSPQASSTPPSLPSGQVGYRSGRTASHGRSPLSTTAHTTPSGPNPDALQPLVVHASGQGRSTAGGDEGALPPSLPPQGNTGNSTGSSRFRFDLRRGK